MNDMVGKFGSMKQQEKRVREKWMQAESTIRAQTSEIERLKKLGELTAKEAKACLKEKNKERGKRLRTEAAIDQLETNFDDMETVYQMREMNLYQCGSFALSKVQEAYTRIENTCPSHNASGNIPMAEELQKIMAILGECMGKGHGQLTDAPADLQIQEEECQALIPMEIIEGKGKGVQDQMKSEEREASILEAINEEPGDF